MYRYHYPIGTSTGNRYDVMTIAAVQSKMARAAVGWGVRDLAKEAGVSVDTVSRLERGEELQPRTLAAIQAALEAAGVEFIPENGGGAGVRLNKPTPRD
jgi:transcriptional regulator with XRE-family HTH domain